MNLKRRIEKIYPLSPMQSGMLFHSLTGEGSHVYFEQILLRIKGKIDKDLFKKSLDILIDRHDVLRTVFRVTKVEEPLQLVLRQRKFSIHVEDISHLNKNEQDMFMEEYKRKDKERGFDLTRDMLMRVALFQTGKSAYSLWWSFHHIIMDGWCTVILYKELVHTYHRLKEGRILQLAPVTPYMNYIKWLEKQDTKVGLRYWHTYLEGYEHQAALTYYLPWKTSGYKPEEYRFVIHERDMSHLQEMALKSQVTLNTVLQGLWGILLMRYANLNDVVFGVVVSGRHPEIEGIETMVGLFINTIPIRIKSRGNPGFSQWLKTIQEDFSSARPHEYLSLAEIQSKSPLKANLIDHIMVVENYPLNEQITGLDRKALFHAADLETYSQTNYDFNISIIHQKHLIVKFSYNAFRYEKDFIEKIGRHLKEVIRQVVNNPGKAIEDIEIITREERQRILNDFNRPRANFPGDKVLHELFREQAERTPGGVALVGKRNTDRETVQLTYRELNRKANQWACMLRERGLRADTIAAIMVERSIEMIVGILAILKAGGAYLPIDPELPGERKVLILNDSSASFLFTQRNLIMDKMVGPSPGIISLEEIDEKVTPSTCVNLENINQSRDMIYVIYTSGSTGKPKGVMLEHRNLTNLFLFQYRYTNIDCSRILQFATLSFDASFHEIFSALLCGGTLYLIEEETRFDIGKLFGIIAKGDIKTVFLPISFLKLIFQQDEYIRLIPSCIKHIQSAGEQVVIGKNFKDYLTKNNIYLHNHYGPSEAHVVTTYTADPAGIIPGFPPIGKPVSNTFIYIVDKKMRLVPIYTAGELIIGGIQVGRGYLNNPELTAQRFGRVVISHSSLVINSSKFSPNDQCPMTNDRFYQTGDLARWLPDGNIQFLGRIDSQVKIRGFRVELGEIETRLLNHPGIKETVVTLRVDENKDKYLCAYIVPDKKTGIPGLREYLAKSLPDYMVPAYFVFIEKIPVTPNGKIDRSALPDPEVKTGDRYTAPRDEIEKKLQEIWVEVLGSNAGIDDNFFKLGGHSLKATVMVAKIHKKINAKVPLAEIFRTPTIRGLAAYIRASAEDRYASIEPVEEKEYYALSSAQKRIYILQQMELQSTVYNLPEIIPLPDDFNLEKIEETFKKLIQRHESLRTSFHMVENELVQKVEEKVEFEIEYFDPEVTGAGDRCRWEDEGTRRLAPLPLELAARSPRPAADLISSFIRPFDLSRAPLLRVGLTHQRALLVDMHHIISDGVSHEILVGDFMALYGDHDLPRLRIRYKDFSGWQNSEPVKKKIIAQETYWLKEFEEEIPVLQLPTDYPRPAIQRFEGDVQDFELEKDLTKALKELALAEKTTVFMVLLTLYNVLLARLSGHEDIIVGIPAAARRHADLEKVIGMFVNTLTIRSRPIGEKRFKDFLAEVKTGTLLAFENQEYPFDNLVEKVEANRDTSRNPLFDVMFNWQTHPELPVEINAQRSNENKNHTAKFDLMLHAREIADRLFFTFEYSTRLFKRKTLERFVNYFISIISGVLSSPGKKLMELEVISEAEKKQLLYEFNDTQTDYPSEMTIRELFEEQVKRTPDSAAVVDLKHKAESAAQLQITYGELDKQSGQLAQVLMEKGVGPDSIVGIMVQRSVEMITGILGILKAGGAYLPIEADYPEHRIKYMLKDSGAKVLLTNLSGAHHFHHSSFLTHHPGHLAYVIYTSGTTGRPNGVMVEHRNVVRLVKNTNYITFKPNDRILQTGILAFDASTFEIWGALLNGLQLFITGLDIILDPVILQETIQNYCITTAWMTSPLFNRLCDENAGIFSGLRNLLVGGDVLSVPHINKIKTMYPRLRVINGYGPTENTTFSTTFSIEKEFKSSIPIGVPISNTTTYIVDRYQRLQPPGVCGELWLGGDGVSRGYLNNPELTAESFCLRRPGGLFSRKPPREASGRPHKSFLLEKNHLQSCSHASMQYHSHYPIAPLPHSPIYRTGDLAQWLPDGNIRFLGRIDSQVKIRGFRIELREIENPLRNHPAVHETIVLAAADETNEKYLCAYIVLKKEEPAVSDLREYLSSQLPDYMIPVYYTFLEKIPLTPNGKVDHRALPAPGAKTRHRSAAPRNETEMKLKEIWTGVLGIDVGIDDNFFEVGGHSLKAVVLAANIHKKLSIKVPLAVIFKAPTIRELAGYIQGIGKEKYASIEPVEKKEYYALSSAQKRIYVLQQMDRQSTVYNMPEVIPLPDDFDLEKLGKTFKKLIRRHESLRTSFHMIENEPVQKIHEEENSGFQITKIMQDFVRPFELSRAPLLRVGLIHQQTLLVDMHHIISDGVSHEILIEDFMGLYGDQPLPGLRIQYKDFSEWQNRAEIKETFKKQENYWLKQFEGEIPILYLPTDYKRPTIQSFEGNLITFELSAGHCGSLASIAAKQGVTMYMVLLALLNILLSKLSGQEDIVMGSPTAGRRHADLGKIIGMFVNTLALRNYPTGEKSFIIFLREVKKRILEAIENQEYPFEELVNNVSAARDAGRNPLFDVMFSLQSTIQKTLQQRKSNLYEDKTAKFDLTITAAETGSSLIFNFQYSTRLFKRETIKRFSTYFKKIVSAVVEEPGMKLWEIEIMPEEEKREILYDFNDTGSQYPKDKTIHELFLEQAARTPGYTAVNGRGQGAGNRVCHLSYGELNKRSDQLAHLLREKGVRPEANPIAAIMVEQSIEMVIGILAILKAGGAYLPIDPTSPQERIDYMLTDSCAQVLLVDDSPRASQLSSAPKVLLHLSAGHHPDFPSSHLPIFPSSLPSSLAYVIYTSGSTGRPKGTLIQHQALNNLCCWHNKHYSVTSGDRAAKYAGIGFDASVWEIFPYLISGAAIYIINEEIKPDIRRLNRFFEENRITIAFLPTQLCEQFMTLENKSLRLLLTGGDKLRTYIKRNYQLVNNYGPTENTVVSTSFFVEREYANIPIGKPIDNTKLHILNRYCQIQPVMVPGELCISGSGLSRGYLNQPELTAEKFIYRSYRSYKTYISEKLYKTGDLARWLPDGNIEFLGRTDDQVKIRGFRIELGEIEYRLLEYPGLKESVVLAKENEQGETDLCVYFVSGNDLSISEIRRNLSQNLPDYMIPSYFMPVEKIPVTLHGKIDRKALPAPGLKIEEIPETPPRNEIETKLVKIWSGLLGIQEGLIGIDSNFFELGGHSLRATVLAANVQKEFNVDLPAVKVFTSPTIRELAQWITAASKSLYAPIPAVEEKEYYHLSHAQKRMWVQSQIEAISISFNMPTVHLLVGELHIPALEQTIQTLVARHESLRTVFLNIDGEVKQKILPLEQVNFNVEHTHLESVPEKEAKARELVEDESGIPFDLATGPLLKLRLIRLENQEHVFFFNIHHIISDFLSFNRFINEMHILYDTFEKGTPNPLNPLPIQYKDYTAWHNKQLKGEQLIKHREYWLKQLTGKPSPLELPLDHQRPAVQTYNGDQVADTLEAAFFKKLKTFSESHQVTLFMTLLTTLNLLFYYYTGQTDILLGTVTAGREHPDLQDQIGFYLNTLSLRTRFDPGDTFVTLLDNVKTVLTNAFAHQVYPFDRLLDDLGETRDRARHPIFDVLVDMLNYNSPTGKTIDQGSSSNIQVKNFDINRATAKFDLTVYFIEGEDMMHINFVYNTDLFTGKTITGMVERFEKLLENVLENPGTPISNLRLKQKHQAPIIRRISREHETGGKN